MPIRPENRHHYSAAAGWPEIRRQVLLWDQDRCAFCGVENRTPIPLKRAECLNDLFRKIRLVVLTVAHLDGSTDHSDPANLRALCQRCHLRHDAKQHAETARVTRAAKRRDQAQQSIEGIAP